MKKQAIKTPRSNALWDVNFSELDRVPAYMRRGVEIGQAGQAITARNPGM